MKSQYRFKIFEKADLYGFYLHYAVFKLIICNKRSVFNAIFIGVNGINRITKQFCNAIIVMDPHPDEGKNTMFGTK